jgi:TonB family protein
MFVILSVSDSDKHFSWAIQEYEKRLSKEVKIENLKPFRWDNQSFVIEKDGSISDVEVTKPVYPSLDAEAVRVIKAMPKWKPGKQDDKFVRVKFKMPVNFRLKSRK